MFQFSIWWPLGEAKSRIAFWNNGSIWSALEYCLLDLNQLIVPNKTLTSLLLGNRMSPGDQINSYEISMNGHQIKNSNVDVLR